MATQQQINDGIAREQLEAAKELAHFSKQKRTAKAVGHATVAVVMDNKDGRSGIKNTALARAVTAIEAKGIAVPQNMNFFFSSDKRVRCVAFMSNATVPDVFLGPKIVQLNPFQPHTDTVIFGGMGGKTSGNRGVASQVYDSTAGSLFGIGDPKLKAQATAIIVHELGVSPEVSQYAMQNALEFVAETFTATVVGGRQFSQGVKNAYAALGGPTSTTFWN
jgi:hypothetical protein